MKQSVDMNAQTTAVDPVVVADIARLAGHFEYAPPDSRDFASDCVRWAAHFERSWLANVASGKWMVDEYIERVDEFTMDQLAKVEQDCIRALDGGMPRRPDTVDTSTNIFAGLETAASVGEWIEGANANAIAGARLVKGKSLWSSSDCVMWAANLGRSTSWLYPAARDAGQLVETYHANGKISTREYKLNDELHRAGGPAREVFDESGLLTESAYFLLGLPHRVGGPARRSWHPNGQMACREYFVNGKADRDPADGPAEISWYENGQVDHRIYLHRGSIHRDPADGPAVEAFYETGEIKSETYFMDGKEHRTDGPAVMEFYKSGVVLRACFCVDGIFSRDPAEGPAIATSHPNGNLAEWRWMVDDRESRDPAEGPADEEFYENGQCRYRAYVLGDRYHRDPADGPAREWFEPDGTRTRCEYHVNGEQVDCPEQPMSAPGGPRL